MRDFTSEVHAQPLRFVPSAADGLPNVAEAIVHSDRLELLCDSRWVHIRFRDIARWQRYGWLFRPVAKLGLGVRGWPMVAARDWFHPPSRRFFRFYTAPPITLYMPAEPAETSYGETTFRRIQEVIASGGFGTMDSG